MSLRSPISLVLALCLCVLLAACNSSDTGTDGGDSSSSSSSSEATVGTRNVSYIGVVQEPGVTIYQQGTHTLALADGKIVLLEASDPAIDLSSYIGAQVEVTGTASPTVEAGGTILSVTTVTVLSSSSSSLSSVTSSSSGNDKTFCGGIAGFACPPGQECVDDPSDDCDPNAGGADCGGMCVTASSSPSSSSSVSSAPVVSSSSSSVSAPASSSSSSAMSGEPTSLEPDIVAMAKQVYSDAAQWTQQYCTTHIGFCIPAHRNWYYKSFGTTTSTLWHVEFGMNEIEELHNGVITLNLVSGTSAQAGGTSGSVADANGKVTGYLDWQDNRHFEIVADARVKAAVEYMLSHITPYDAAQ